VSIDPSPNIDSIKINTLVIYYNAYLLSDLSDRQNTSNSGRPTNRSFSRPVEIGKEYTVDITDTGRTGDGVTRIGGLVIFVKNGKAGDKNIKIKISSVGSRFANAIVVSKSSTDST
jgi:predicted RNA-binding protein with TRAM domain